MTRPRVIFVGHSVFDLPLTVSERVKWDALSDVLDLRVVAAAGRRDGRDARFCLVRGGPAFYAALPLVVRAQAHRHRAEVIVAMSPYEAAMVDLAWPRRATRPAVLVEVHGDWATAARLYGSPARRVLAAPADAIARRGLQRADAIRTVGPAMRGLIESSTGRTAAAVFPAWTDARVHWDRPVTALPPTPALLWVGALQEVKDPRLAIAAWDRIAQRHPAAHLRIVGQGPLEPLVAELVRRYPGRVRHDARLAPEAVSTALDEAWVLLVSSRSEGFSRVALEAFARGRPVVATRVGGLPDLVVDGLNGRLVPHGDAQALARAAGNLLEDPALVARLGAHARHQAAEHRWPPERWASAMRDAVEAALTARRTGT